MRTPPWTAIAIVLACGDGREDGDATAATATAAATTTTAEASTTSTTEASTSSATTTTSSASTSSASTSTGEDPGTTEATTGDPGGCAVIDVPGACVDVLECPPGSTPFQAICGAPPAIQCCVDAAPPCSVDGSPGLCVAVDTCAAPLVATPGLCPGDADVQCCTDPARACDPGARPLVNEGLHEEVWDPTCPKGMVAVDEFCIDRYEAALVELDDGGEVIGSWSPYVHPGAARVRAVSLRGAIPQGYISQLEAAAACDEAGKRLCTDAEWLRACQGAGASIYPYGDVVEPGTCNDHRDLHPAIEYFGTSDPWIWSELGDPCISQIPASLAVTGQHPGCVAEDGALDLVGNLHEWTADPAGTFRGGFYVDTVLNGPGCLYVTTAHDVGHWDYSTGFRCCAD